MRIFKHPLANPPLKILPRLWLSIICSCSLSLDQMNNYIIMLVNTHKTKWCKIRKKVLVNGKINKNIIYILLRRPHEFFLLNSTKNSLSSLSISSNSSTLDYPQNMYQPIVSKNYLFYYNMNQLVLILLYSGVGTTITDRFPKFADISQFKPSN